VKPFNAAPLVPVKFTENLANTIFREEYFRELSSMLIDNLNMVYVAFTRAASVLRVNIPAKKTDNRIGRYIEQTVRNLSQENDFVNSWDEERKMFSYGKLPDSGEQTYLVETKAPSGWIFTDFSNKLQLRSDNEDFFDQTEKGDFRKNRGNTLHSILAEINTVSDVEPAINRALASAILLPVEKDFTREKLTDMIHHPVARNWFSGTWKVYVETDLLTENNTFRPDRVLIRDKQAVVVDYKSGSTKQEAHLRQVQRYVSILKETGIQDVKGYLWYIGNNELLEV
jgi:ATP-dependent exoDNAse (exonuclease V) beta subunit